MAQSRFLRLRCTENRIKNCPDRLGVCGTAPSPVPGNGAGFPYLLFSHPIRACSCPGSPVSDPRNALPGEPVSTRRENIVLIQYFQKRCDFKAVLTCKTAGFFWPGKTAMWVWSTRVRIGRRKGSMALFLNGYTGFPGENQAIPGFSRLRSPSRSEKGPGNSRNRWGREEGLQPRFHFFTGSPFSVATATNASARYRACFAVIP